MKFSVLKIGFADIDMLRFAFLSNVVFRNFGVCNPAVVFWNIEPSSFRELLEYIICLSSLFIKEPDRLL